MPLAEAFLVDAQTRHGLGLPALQSAAHRALQDAVNFVPAQREQLADAALAGFAQPGDGQGLEQRGEEAAPLGPRQPHDSRTMFGAVAARRLSVQNRAELAGVEMPPTPFRLMVVERACRAALRASPTRLLIVIEVDVKSRRRPARVPLAPPATARRRQGSVGTTRDRPSREPTSLPPSSTTEPEEPLLKARILLDLRGLVLLAVAELFVPVLHHLNLRRLRAAVGPIQENEAPVAGDVVGISAVLPQIAV